MALAVPAIRIGCAGWSIGYAKEILGGEGSQLERYARVFDAVEINSSFYRPHRPGIYARWAASVPAGFRFSVKMPRELSHVRRLRDCSDPLQRFLGEATQLGDKLGALLLQLPPSLAFEATAAEAFFGELRAWHNGGVACEPRHASWFDLTATQVLRRWRIARVAADPARVPRAAAPGGDAELQYLRLHGSPRMYYSAYDDALLARVGARLRKPSATTRGRWCIFDNTARGHAVTDALRLRDWLTERA